MTNKKNWLPGVLAAVFVAVGAGSQAAAQENFYAGKTIKLIVGAGVGGGFDLYSRALAATMEKTIPGSPKIIIQNVGGGGAPKTANLVYNEEPRDGTVIGISHASAFVYQLLGGKNVTYKSDDLAWLGRLTTSNQSIFTWTATGIKTIDDAKKREVVLGASDLTSPMYIYPELANRTLGTKFKVILGFGGGPAADLAVENGEIEGHAAGELNGLFGRRPHWIKENKISILLQFGDQRDPRIPNVPTMKELLTEERDRQIVDLVSLPVDIGYAYYVSPEVPQDRVNILRDAFAKALKDPGFISAMEKIGSPINYAEPDFLASKIDAIAKMPDDLKAEAAKLVLPK